MTILCELRGTCTGYVTSLSNSSICTKIPFAELAQYVLTKQFLAMYCYFHSSKVY